MAVAAAPLAEAPLAARLPPAGAPPLGPDAVLDRFVAWVSDTGLSLYPHQEEGILALLDGKHLVLSTPTGSGKSLVATFLHFKAMAEGRRSFYTCPIKALVNEKFFDLCRLFGPENVGMMTGDAAVNKGAPIVCCTAEILMNLALREAEPRVDCAVMDEFHYYADRERGVAWQVPLLLLEKTTFLLMSATLGDVTAIAGSLEGVTGRKVAEVKSAERPVPLEFEYRETPLHETIEDLVSAGKAPIYLVNFTQRAAAEQAQNLMSANFASREQKEAIRAALTGVRFDTPFGKDFQRFLRHGVGLHHAGLLPRYRLTVEKLAQGGLLKVVSGTDTLGMGVNIPIRTVLFTQLCKYDGEKTAILSARDFRQISGRAGRKGFDERGYVVAQAPEHVVENKRLAEKEKAGGKKFVKRQPPQKGYVHWDRSTFERLREKEPEPLESRFEVTFGLLLNLLQAETTRRGGGYARLVELVGRSHGSDVLRSRHRTAAAQRFRTLRAAGLLELHAVEGYRGRFVRPARGLQRDFSLFHTLSLYLLDSLERIDPVRESYALDVLTQVESILEDPDAILWKQLDRARGEAVARMKAEGLEYDERMAELEKVEYPKPNADFVYSTFNEFAAKHPWVGQENIRAKSVAREMVERCQSFNDYVREYELQRSEGLVLRYLAEAYKTLAQTVPERFRDEALEDVLAFLRTTVRGVDSSLLDEWERMRSGEAAEPRAAPEAAPPRPALPFDPAQNPRAFAARVRADLHRLLGALARRSHEEAAAALWQPGGEWTPRRLEEAMAPYWAEHPRIDVTPAARRPHNTFLDEAGPRRWKAVQRIVDEAGEVDWVLECQVDLSAPRDPDLPLVELVRIGT
jgi:superfamily II RNA helicase